MSELLTSKQVQEILKVDRITIYRMLKDGRLKGVKIGQQWRFPQDEVDRLLGRHVSEIELAVTTGDNGFPTHCVQTIQDLFSDVSQIPAKVIDMDGEPLTKMSNPCGFCKAILGTPAGYAACRESWRNFAKNSQSGSKFSTCHAGLQFVGAPVSDKSGQIGLVFIGQFYWQQPDPREEAERVRRLAQMCGLRQDALQEAAANLQVIPPEQHSKVEGWPSNAARAMNSILHERISFMERLAQIADLTQIA